MHGIDEGKWLAFLDGERCPEVEAHLRECMECGEICKQLQACQEALRMEASFLRDAAGTGDPRIEQMLEACLGELSDGRAWTPQQATLLLRSLLEPLCGAGAAKSITDLTLRRSPGTNRSFDSAAWRLFVRNLSEDVESICGSATGRLVGCAGLSLSVRNA